MTPKIARRQVGPVGWSKVFAADVASELSADGAAHRGRVKHRINVAEAPPGPDQLGWSWQRLGGHVG
jgi:hypothetical protein